MFNPQLLQSGDLESLRNELNQMFNAIAREQAQQSEYLALKTLYGEPKRLLDGMIVKADGTTWNPGSGAGVYVYRGAAWHLLG